MGLWRQRNSQSTCLTTMLKRGVTAVGPGSRVLLTPPTPSPAIIVPYWLHVSALQKLFHHLCAPHHLHGWHHLRSTCRLHHRGPLHPRGPLHLCTTFLLHSPHHHLYSTLHFHSPLHPHIQLHCISQWKYRCTIHLKTFCF